ncbi:MAG: PQQ-binding-like beta-propeller repeat protein [Candidatus Acidiferrales bacterium]
MKRTIELLASCLAVVSIPFGVAVAQRDVRAAVAIAAAAQKPASESEGAKLFAAHCASCHTPFNPVRAPWPQTLQLMTQQTILQALETGRMQAQGSTMTHEERFVLASYLGRKEPLQTGNGNACPANQAAVASAALWNGWGVDLDNSRFQPDAAAGLAKSDVPRLRVKWAFGLPGATGAGGPATIFRGRLYFGGGDGAVHALDARTGCQYWSFLAPAAVRTAISVSDEGKIAYFGDVQARAYAVDTSNGAVIWKTDLDQHPFAMITGAPKLNGGKLYVPVSSAEELGAANPKYECCTFRGSVAALDAKTGRILWQTYTIAENASRVASDSDSGKASYGPSGAAVWNSPTIDSEKGVMYFGTGDNYSENATATSDAIFAVRLEDGKTLWVKQLTKGDAFNIGCVVEDKANCPKDAGPDFDIGAPPILRKLNDGKRILIVGQKSGVVYGLDPDDKGNKVWQTRIGKGSALGGVEFGAAADEKTVYVPLSDWNPDPKLGGGVFALEIATGKKVWNAAPAVPTCIAKPGCSAAQPAPATLISGVVFSGSMDGHMRAYDTATGAVVWDFDTTGSFPTVNGVDAHGGSLNYAGAVVAGGMVYVMAGYSINAGMPGNVVLAFSVDGK